MISHKSDQTDYSHKKQLHHILPFLLASPQCQGNLYTTQYKQQVHKSNTDTIVSGLVVHVIITVCRSLVRHTTSPAARLRSMNITPDTHTHTHSFNGPLSGITQVSRYPKGKTNRDFTEARNSELQWHILHTHTHTRLTALFLGLPG